MSLTSSALKYKTTVFVGIVILVILGMNSYRSLPLESAPDVQIPIILVHTIYPGVAPADMETLVTNILERELKDLDDVKEMTSSSAESSSMIKLEFSSDVEMDDAYQKVRDKVDQAKADLPPDAEDPMLIEITSSDWPIMLVSLSADYSMVKLKKVAEDIQDRIEGVSGVLSADITGGLEREIQVYLDPQRMHYYGLGVGQVINRVQQEHLTTPGGNLELGGTKYLVRIPGEYKNVSLMNEIVLKAPEGHPVKIKDVGRVIDGFKERETISRSDGKECITLRVKKRSGENIVRIADEIRELLKDMQPMLPAGTEVSIRQDASKDVKNMVTDLENNIITGLLLVLAVLFFSMGLRNATFVAVAIPLSMLITFIVLRAFGITLNFVVLFSLILALGMLVDNSIVVVENIFRHASEGLDRETAAQVATQEVAWPVISSTATTVGAFAPMLFWPDVMGEFMGYLPKTVIIALLASLFVALVINPVVAATFLSKRSKALFDDSGEVKGLIMPRYKKVLEWSLNHPLSVFGGSIVMLVVTMMLFGTFGAGVEFFPTTTPDRAQVTIKGPQGTMLQTTDGYSKQIETVSMKRENMKDVVGNVGVSSGMFGSQSATHSAVIDLEFKDRHERSSSTWDDVDALRKVTKNMVGAEFQVKIEEHGPPTGDPISVEISGPDFKKLDELASEAMKLLQTIPGTVDLKDDFDGAKPEIRIDIDREKAMLRKVNTQSISQAVRTAINGTEAAKLREGDEEYDITVRFDDPFRKSIKDIEDIIVTGKDDVQIPLRDVAKVYTTAGLGSINHIDQKRSIKVSGDVSGRSSSEVILDAKKLLTEKMTLPAGYQLYFGGESEEQDKAAAFLGEAFMIGLMVIALVLITQFNSVTRPAIILGSVVMSMMGVLLGLMITQNKFGIIMTGMGVISLAGVVVNNAIVLIDYTNQLVDKAGMKAYDALVRAGLVRFRPVLLTAITTILGMTPMALGIGIDFTTLTLDTGSSSVEWWGPMAQAVIFGLSFATILTLVLVPVMYILQLRLTDWTDKVFKRYGDDDDENMEPTESTVEG